MCMKVGSDMLLRFGVANFLLEKGFVNAQIFGFVLLGGHKLHNEFQLTDLCESENIFFSCFSELETNFRIYQDSGYDDIEISAYDI